jgi:hypothetical protein
MKKLIVILAAIAMVGAFTATAMADVDLYGSARMWTYRISADKEATGTAYDADDTRWRMGPFSRFGANFKSDKITGKFELDARDSNDLDGASGVGDMRLRILWGEWDFGAGKLGVGHNWPITDWNITLNQWTGGGLQSYGSTGFTWARTSQIRLTFDNLKISFTSPDKSQGGLSNYTSRMERVLPKIEARYSMKLDMVALDFLGGYQSYKAYNATDQDKSIDSYLLGIRGKFNFGPAYLNLAARWDVNGGNYGVSSAVRSNAVWNATSNDVEDTTAWGVAGAIGYKINDMFTLEAYYGKTKSEDDRPGNWEDEAQMYGVTAKITLAPGVYLFPEFGIEDGEDITNNAAPVDQGKVTYMGMVWRIDFK